MDTGRRLNEYRALLAIRRKGRLREVRLSGAVFLSSVLLTIASGLLNPDPGRALYLLLGLNTAFGAGCLAAWVRLEIVRSAQELLAFLLREMPAAGPS